MKYPWVTLDDEANRRENTIAYAAMPCTLCHGPHGSGNTNNLRTKITVAGVVMSTGWEGDSTGIGGYKSDTYVMPVQDDHYWGGWCSFCHDYNGHKEDALVACNNPHMHNGGGF